MKVEVRYWDEINKCYRYSGNFCNLSDFFKMYEDYKKDLGRNKNVELEHYSGLKDKNGFNIYEGDIVKVPYNNIGNNVVKFEDGGYNVRRFAIHKCFVVGNINQNPELLEP